MRTRLSIIGTVAVLALTLLAPAAEGVTLEQQVRKLARKVRVLEARTRNLNTRLVYAEGITDCVAYAVPLSYYGDGQFASFGYRFYNGDGLPEFYTTAVDFAGPGEVPDIWVAGFSFSPLCVPATARAKTNARGELPRFRGFAPGAQDRAPTARHKSRAQGM